MKQNMIRIRKLAIALAALALLVSSIDAEPMAIDFGVNDTVGYPNSFVKVPVNITNVQNESIAGIVFDIHFNSSVINLTKNRVQKGDLTFAWESPNFNPSNGRISIVFGGNGTEIPIGRSGSAIILNFSVVGFPGSKSEINLSGIQISDLQGTVGTAPARNGTFTIEGLPGAISGMKFYDSNGNGTKDSGDTGLVNWTIVLKNSSGSIVKTTKTDLNGNYIFERLANGNYAVEEVLQADWKQTFPKAPGIYNVTLATGENVTDRDFGNMVNVTQIKPAGRPIITNFTPSTSSVIDVIGGPTRTFAIIINQTVDVSWKIDGIEISRQENTNSSFYSNVSVAPGIWNISALAQNANGSYMQTWTWNVTQQIPGNGSISGMKYNDSNGNGIKDTGESGLLNWTIVLKKNQGTILDTTMTDLNGNYRFSDLATGNYAVEEVMQTGWKQTFPENQGKYNVTLAEGENIVGKDFGNNLMPSMPIGVNGIREIEKESLRFGESTNVTIKINGDLKQSFVLQESIPQGWILKRISDDAMGFKNTTNEWVWPNITPGVTRTVIYQLTNSAGANMGTYYINGTLGNMSGAITGVGGNNMITLDIYTYYRKLGNNPDKVETRDVLIAMDDWGNRKAQDGFARPISINELSTLIDEWTRT